LVFELEGDFVFVGRDSPFGFVAGFAMCVPLNSPFGPYSIGHSDVVDLEAKTRSVKNAAQHLSDCFQIAKPIGQFVSEGR
jgi:hypothetical protein